ncbi:hypothetical protein AKO1_001295, partial [Acrasis kona]
MKNQDRILFVLDGYDEVTNSLCEPTLTTLFSVLFRQTDFKPYIVMTSRPMPVIKISRGIIIDFNHHLRCIGFTDENIPKFVEKYFIQAKDEQTQKFVTLLKSNRNIWAISHVPVSLELLCYSWLKKKVQGQSTTLSSLYTDVVQKIYSTEFEKNKATKLALKIYK